ncbi:transposon TX1 uncharacterized 149 kDa protein [Eleginops maclovinus]|uniref:transposon TX1 uncharacterized 149 kDa protein n=1 Tax=Eleginops maclovinus TaxID=56733 RepID=UPI00308109D2
MARSLRALEREVVELQGLADSTGEREHVEVFKSRNAALSDLLGFSAQGALVRSQFQNIVKMDAPSHFFFGLERRNGQRRLMHSLRSDTGQLLQESADIQQCAVRFYRSDYQAEPEAALSFFEGLPKVPEGDSADLEAELSAQELQEALQSMQSGKAPGIDGLPADFYKVFWPVMGDDLLDVLRDSLSKGRLPLSCRRAVLTLLPKKGDLQELGNWRPVSLLCTDYKLLSKVLATRLRRVMEHVIHVDQTYCVPSRLITDNVTLIRDVLDLSSSLGCKLGLISLDQEKHQYLWQTLEAFGFSSGLIAKIQVLYRDIESVLKINGRLCAPFKAERGVRQGCSLSGMLYSLAIEPLLHNLRSKLHGFSFPGCDHVLKLSAYADDVMVIVKTQQDINALTDTVGVFSKLSSARVNWGKSEALAVGAGHFHGLVLPGGLVWKRGGLKYLGVYLGDETFCLQNWDGLVEKVEGRLKKWMWILPYLSFKGRILILNNLVSSMLAHRLACSDPPVNLLSRVQALMVDFFWDRMHWVPQSILFLPKEEGGHGLVHLASRGAAFRLRFVQRFLTGPADLVWRPVARAVLERCGGLGLAESLFLMDIKGVHLDNLSCFYKGLFKVWGLFRKERTENCASLFWLLKEPVVHGTRFLCGIGPSLQQRLCEEKILTLGHVLEVCGPCLDNAAGLAARLGIRSVRVTGLLLSGWKQQLSDPELALAVAFCNGLTEPNENDSFPEILCVPDVTCDSFLLRLNNVTDFKFSTMSNKRMYYLMTKVLNQSRLQGRVDTRWRAHLALTETQRPEWRALYKPPLTKRLGDLQWRILHGAVAVNAFVSVINPAVSDTCPFCDQRETIFHCFSECDRLLCLFQLLTQMFVLFGEVFSPQVFILGYRYTQRQKVKCQLLNFLLGQAKMAIYLSRRNKVGDSMACNAVLIFK